ncbi:MAG: hypothetical protein JWN40_4707 [Phycisphaerales bacterium]|nr:hypothetical protein [Phycisphaerales bacterium]
MERGLAERLGVGVSDQTVGGDFAAVVAGNLIFEAGVVEEEEAQWWCGVGHWCGLFSCASGNGHEALLLHRSIVGSSG